MNYFEYKGISYPFKSIYFHSADAEYIVSCEDLEKALLPDGSSYDSEEARFIDEQIFFFLSFDMLNQSEEVIEQYVSEAL